eukprot:6150291-Prorocentrum_lima.AAC.1
MTAIVNKEQTTDTPCHAESYMDDCIIATPLSNIPRHLPVVEADLHRHGLCTVSYTHLRAHETRRHL